MATTFQKMHGAGNDFVLVDLRHQDCGIDADMVVRLSDRKTGVGCDQVLVLHAPDRGPALARFEVWNADGSRAEQCGNGVRCIGHYLERRGETPAGRFTLQGPVAEISLQCLPGGLVRVNMGPPEFEPERIPVGLEPVEGLYTLRACGENYRFGVVSMGNPHAVLEVDDLDAAEVGSIGRCISTHPAFPAGCNVGFAAVQDRQHINLRVFERGAGETLACGSGACAAVAVLASRGEVATEVRVNQPGGELIIGWDGGDGPVFMTGPAVHVFEGTFQ